MRAALQKESRNLETYKSNWTAINEALLQVKQESQHLLNRAIQGTAPLKVLKALPQWKMYASEFSFLSELKFGIAKKSIYDCFIVQDTSAKSNKGFAKPRLGPHQISPVNFETMTDKIVSALKEDVAHGLFQGTNWQLALNATRDILRRNRQLPIQFALLRLSELLPGIRQM